MPIMDGITSATKIRKEEQMRGWKPIPIIGVSANVTKYNMRQCKMCGMSGFVAKPYRKSELFTQLCRFVCAEKSKNT